MSLNTGKHLLFLFLLSLSAIYAPTASAQNKKTEQISSGEARSTTLETGIGAALEKISIDKTTDAPDAPQADGSRWENILEVKIGGETVKKNEHSNVNRQAENDSFNRHFSLNGERERKIDFDASTTGGQDKSTPLPPPGSAARRDDTKKTAPLDDIANKKAESFHWQSAIKQSLMFLAVQHGYSYTQPKTREALKGKFWNDYVKSVKSLHGWDDGGRFFTNYIAHPMEGSFLGFVQIQNDPRGLKQQFGASSDYWRSRLKAMAWTAAWSTQFEIGPVSQASIGNVGLKGKQTYVDIVVTPTIGTALLVGEDALDRFVMKRIERGTSNFYVIIFSRMLLSPTRTAANLFRFKTPWHRDRPREH